MAALGGAGGGGCGAAGVCMNYYNEFDPKAAAGLRSLISAGEIPPGEVDERSIVDVKSSELTGYTQCHFFAGIGGWPLALRLAGVADSARLWTGSCPCQPFSAAGAGGGLADERHLWPYWQWLIQQCRPSVVFGEQVASKSAELWVDLVHADLEAMGYAFGCVPFPSASVGAYHVRDRAYWAAEDASNPERDKQSREESRIREVRRVGRVIQSVSWEEPWESALSRLRVVGDGFPRSVGACDAARNAINPIQAAEFIRASGLI